MTWARRQVEWGSTSLFGKLKHDFTSSFMFRLAGLEHHEILANEAIGVDEIALQNSGRRASATRQC